jgi:hypothetical protein
MSSRRSSSRFHLLPSLTTHSPLSLIGGMTPGAGRHVTKESQGMDCLFCRGRRANRLMAQLQHYPLHVKRRPNLVVDNQNLLPVDEGARRSRSERGSSGSQMPAVRDPTAGRDVSKSFRKHRAGKVWWCKVIAKIEIEPGHGVLLVKRWRRNARGEDFVPLGLLFSASPVPCCRVSFFL